MKRSSFNLDLSEFSKPTMNLPIHRDQYKYETSHIFLHKNGPILALSNAGALQELRKAAWPAEIPVSFFHCTWQVIFCLVHAFRAFHC